MLSACVQRVGGRCWSSPLKPYLPPPGQQQAGPTAAGGQGAESVAKAAASSASAGGSGEAPLLLVDCGASFIHGIDRNPLTEICELQGFTLHEPNGSERLPIFDWDGKLHPDERANRWGNEGRDGWHEMKTWMADKPTRPRMHVPTASSLCVAGCRGCGTGAWTRPRPS